MKNKIKVFLSFCILLTCSYIYASDTFIKESKNLKDIPDDSMKIIVKEEVNNSQIGSGIYYEESISEKEAVSIANNYMHKYYSSDKFLKNINEPSSVIRHESGWLIFYEDIDLVRFPAGVEIFVDGSTGQAYRINQE